MQNRLRNYKHSILSFEHNIFNFGLHSPGRYVGFDTLVPEDNQSLQFKVGHDKTGFNYKDQVNQIKGPLGVCMSPQGVLIQEDSPVGILSIDSNLGNAETRYDLVVLNHVFTVIAGGSNATYTIIKGPIGNPIKPVLADPLTQIAVGVIEVPPNVDDIRFCTYHKAKCPDSGDGEDARLDSPNTFGYVQQENLGTKKTLASASGVNGLSSYTLWELDNNGNSFEIAPVNITTFDGLRIKDVPLQQGTRISLFITDKVTIREQTAFSNTSYYASGYRPIKVPPGLGNITVFAASSSLAIKPTTGQVWEVALVYYAGYWVVSYLNGVTASSGLGRGDITWWFGDVASNFDATGLGINLRNGTAFCNGLNNTPDLRGKILAVASNYQFPDRPDLTDEASIALAGLDPDDYILGNYGTSVGKKSLVINQGQLPSCFFNITDPGHFHYQFANTKVGTKGPTSSTYVPWSSNNANGNQDYDLCQTNLPATIGKSSSQTTGIQVHSGGNGETLGIVPPVFMLVATMKL